MKEEFNRTNLIIGEDAIKKLQQSKVAIFGLGGVGSYAAEALSRAGVGKFILIDADIIELSNINRQLYALHSTIGKPKVEVAKSRIIDINLDANVETYKEYWNKDSTIDLSNVDYIIDAIDSVTSKIELIVKAKELNIGIISAMGAGNKIDASKFKVDDIYNTSVCPLAKVIRKELKKRNINCLKVVYSTEEPKKIKQNDNGKEYIIEDKKTKTTKQSPGSMPNVPGTAGLIIAGEVIKNLIAEKQIN